MQMKSDQQKHCECEHNPGQNITENLIRIGQHDYVSHFIPPNKKRLD